MRRGLAWAAGVAGILAALLVRRRREGTAAVAPPPDPADELRRKLAAARAPETPPPPTPPAAVPEPRADADERRRDVHAQARAAIDEMRGIPGESPE